MNKALKITVIFILIFFIVWKLQRFNKNPTIFYVKKPFGNFNGYILPPFGVVIKNTEKGNTDFLTHELTHWAQWRENGVLFLIDYYNQQNKNGYKLNKYEIEARKKSGESEYCQTNYTECVRSGEAKAHNPNFRK